LYAENHPNSNAFYCHGVNMNGFWHMHCAKMCGGK
jgi:hypothetical protein